MLPSEPAPILPYATPATPAGLDGVVIHRDGDQLRRVIVPPIRRWGDLGHLRLSIIGLTLIVLVGVPLVVVDHVMLGPIAEFGVALAIAVCVAIDRLRTRVAIEVTPWDLTVHRVGPFGVARVAWPRAAVLGVTVGSVDHRLRIRLAGIDTYALDLGPDPAATERVMHEVIASLTVIPVAPIASSAPPPTDALVPPQDRHLFAVAAGILVVLGFIGFYVFPPLGCGAILFAAVPVGIAFGTQPNKTWM